MGNFWAIRWLPLKDDYEQLFVNGYAQYPFSIPGIDCPNCGGVAGSRVLPFGCPQEFRRRKELREPQVLPLEKHRILCAEIEDALRRDGAQVRLEPGDQFQPVVLDLPSLPSVDFFWAYAGGGTVITSERVRTLFENARVRGALFCPVVLRKVGRMATLPEDLRQLCPTGEPMEMLMSADTRGEPSPDNPYHNLYQMLPSTEPVGTYRIRVGAPRCPLCGCPQVEDDLVESVTKELTIDRNLAQKVDVDVFVLADVGLVVSAKVREIILAHELSNCDLIPLSWESKRGRS